MVSEETQAPDDSSEATNQVEQTETSEGEGEPEISWQERAEAAEALVTKGSNDFKALQGQMTRQETIEDLIGGFNDRFDGFEAEMRSRLQSVASGEIDTMDEEAEAAREPYATRVQATIARRINDDGMAAIDDALDDGDGTALLDKQAAPELADMRSIYNEGVEHLNAGRLAQAREKFAVAENAAVRAAKVALRAASKQAKADVAAASKAAVAQALEEAGVDDMSAGPGAAGGGAITRDNIDNMMANIDDYDAKTQASIREKYRGLMTTGRFS